MSEVILERPAPGVALVRLNRPEARNALNMALRRALAETFRSLAAERELRAIVIAGDERAFAAGADLKEMAEAGPIEMLERATHRLWRALTETPQPLIAAVRGFALGGGLELALMCDIVIAGEGARFGQPEVKVGILPGAGGTQRLMRALGKYRALPLLLTGRAVSGAEAYALGLVSELVPDREVLERALALAREIAALPPLAVQQIKEVALAGEDASLETALALERKAFQLLFASEDQKEGMRAFLEKRKPAFKGR